MHLPRPAKEFLLSGHHLRHPKLIAFINDLGFSVQHLNTFPRAEMFDALQAQRSTNSDFSVSIVERKGFGGTELEMNEYIQHLIDATYVVCPRGTENYSYRLYETLSFGRVPVILDTQVVLPEEIDWEKLCVRIPYSSMTQIYDVIRDDYESRDAAEFLQRQDAAIKSMQQVRSLKWMDRLASRIVEAARRSRKVGSEQDVG
jgi:hypothetical protein